ncbi:hypothetical protein PACTADRAFT_48956 [Pachysolen tannophilus NRRL Y-2460]|uniref:U3 small nucleolar RNA-associated protein 10 n=1 Tax=Pachysolen tannophilus NRRL Y-2460 TaxID=669874 RepID=A0A1E4TZN6_PACTA|nr:hypothetical protein PACTADRAFT_48956 [Pachysolen tannophilus NRRL Y-2460]
MSLSQQLSTIAGANQTLALDRKKRSKLHSVSLIYDPKFASTQDYDSIYQVSLDALEELELIDKRFGRFKLTIFSETSISVDRLIQTKEQNENLNKTIDAFLSLLSPYWNLNIAVKAAEWPLRRFQMNVYNSETFLLSALPYFDYPVFNKILYVLPSGNNGFPNIFHWLINFKKNNELPSRNVIIKAFTDLDFFKFYSKFLIEQLHVKNENQKQLIFYVTCCISSIASLASNDNERLNNDFTPLILEVSAVLLNSNNQDCKISSYTILSVLTTAVPLSKETIFASIEAILEKNSSKLNKQALICILKLYQSLQSGSYEKLPTNILNKLPPSATLFNNEEFIGVLNNGNNSKFISNYLRSCIVNDKLEQSVLDFLRNYKIKSSRQFKDILNDLLNKLNTSPEKSSNLTAYFEWLISLNRDLFLITLKEQDFELQLLEMKLQTTLITDDISTDEVNNVEVIDELSDENDLQINSEVNVEELRKSFELNKVNVKSFLHSTTSNDSDFKKLLPLFFTSIESKTFQIFNKNCLISPSSAISFLLRVAISLNIPTKARLFAIVTLRKRFKELQSSFSLYTLVPLLIVLLADSKQLIRLGAIELIKTINDRPSEKIGESYMINDIYGEELSSNLVSLNPTDGKKFLNELTSLIDSCKLDGEQIFRVVDRFMEQDKKSSKLYLALFVSHASSNNLPIAKARLLKIVVNGTKIVKNAASPSQLFDTLLTTYIDKRIHWQTKCIESGTNFQTFEAQIVDLISFKEKNLSAIEFLEKSFSSSSEELANLCSSKIIRIFESLKFDYQLRFVKFIVDNTASGDSNISYDPVELLQSLTLTNEIFVQLLKDTTLTQTQPTNGSVPKRRRRSSQSTRQAMKDSSVSKIAINHLKKVISILEVLEKHSSSLSTSTLKPTFDLLKKLFDVLSDFETLGNDGNLPVLYAQEILASCMLNVVNFLKNNKDRSKIESSLIRADVIVAAIRSSSSPQVQNKLLLVVAALASLSPEIVLHSVMPIFTFMGAHTIRQDDEFSNHVVEQTISCVVPALANVAENGKTDEIEFLLTSFVSAFQHIPRHRRVKLFMTLSKTLGTDLSISTILFLCGQQYSFSFSKHKITECRSILEFSSSFLKNFKAEEQLKSFLKFLELWELLPSSPIEKNSSKGLELSSRSIFGSTILSLTKPELFNLRNNLISFLNQSLIGNNDLSSLPRLKIKIATLLLDPESNVVEVEQINNSFGEVVSYILTLLDSSALENDDDDVSGNLYKLLGDVLNLLPIDQFVKSVIDILTSESLDLRVKRHLTMLAGSKFELEPVDNFVALECAEKFIPILTSTVELKLDVDVSQASLDTLSAIFNKFGSRLDDLLLMNTLSVIVTESGLLSNSPEIVISAVNCITNIISVIGVKMIGFFPKIVSPAFKIFEMSKSFEDENLIEITQVSILILCSCMIKKIPAFMISSLEQILNLVLNAKSLPSATRVSLLDVTVQHIDTTALLKSLCSIWPAVSKLDPVAIGLYLHALELTVDKLDKKAALKHAPTFMKFFVHSLEYRSGSDFDNNTIHRIEASLFQCGIHYVMKLNDKSFRPLFASISRWAFDGEGINSTISEEDRLLAFFRFFNKLQQNLKSIITSYYSYMLESVEKLLNRFVSGNLKDINLRRIIIISLNTSFKYDQDEFWQSQARFDVISKALLSQLVNIEDGIGKYLVKTIASLSQRCSSDDHNKMINEQLISHMRLSCNPKEKFWASRTFKMIYQKVGESWLSLLPQLVPIIAELLDDDDEEVEHEVRTGLVKVIEGVLGEPLDRYLD